MTNELVYMEDLSVDYKCSSKANNCSVRVSLEDGSTKIQLTPSEAIELAENILSAASAAQQWYGQNVDD